MNQLMLTGVFSFLLSVRPSIRLSLPIVNIVSLCVFGMCVGKGFDNVHVV